MLKIVNPGLGKAMMVSNPSSGSRVVRLRNARQSGVIRGASKTRRSKKRKYKSSTSRRKTTMAYFPKRRRKRKGARRRRNVSLVAAPSAANKLMPSMKDVTQDLASGVVGMGAFVVSSVLGKGANLAFEKIDEMSGGALAGAGMYVVGPAKFAARYLGARALRVYVFKDNSGLMSKANGALVQEIVLVSGVMALLSDLGLLDKIPVIGEYLPKLSGQSNITRMGIAKYENYSGNMAGYKTWEGNRWSGKLRGYAQGGTLSGYARGGTLSANMDNYRPNDHLKVPTYGVPAGA